MSDDDSKNTLNSPFWLVRKTQNAEEANLKMENVMFKGNYQLTIRPSSAADFSLGLPILKNSKPIKEGDELVALWPEASEGGETGKAKSKAASAAKAAAKQPNKRKRS